MSSKRCHWKDFVRFIKDEAFWSRWTYILGEEITEGQKYFISAVEAVRADKVEPWFDFDKTDVCLIAGEQGRFNMDLDGEHVSRFFEAWFKNPGV